MRIATLNIRHGGDKAIPRLLEHVARVAPDILVITEYRTQPEECRLVAGLRNLGLASSEHSKPELRMNGVLVASRWPLNQTRHLLTEGPHRQRLLAVETNGLRVVGAYFPQKTEKHAVFDAVLPWLREHVDQCAVLIGDLNTGKHRSDEEGATFIASRRMRDIDSTGWIDAWRHVHADRQEFSWYSSRPNGFRVDHAFVSPRLQGAVTNAWYDHSTREGETKATDHSLLAIELADKSPEAFG
jgi:exonuclease III